MGWRSWNLFELDVSQALIEAQIAGLTRRRHKIDGKPTSLLDLGYSSIGLDDGWQDCGNGLNHTYHSADGTPLVNATRFPDMGAMVAAGHAAGVQMGWYANNCWCNEGQTDKSGWPRPYYEGNAKATVGYKFDAIKIDSCGPSRNITAWREALDSAAAAAGRGRVQIENCRNYEYTKNITKTTECAADFFRSTEDNAPDFLSIMANLVMNDKAPVRIPARQQTALPQPEIHRVDPESGWSTLRLL
jgi:alpha-galactosidase